LRYHRPLSVCHLLSIELQIWRNKLIERFLPVWKIRRGSLFEVRVDAQFRNELNVKTGARQYRDDMPTLRARRQALGAPSKRRMAGYARVLINMGRIPIL